MNSWLFQGNPEFYKVRAALHHFIATSQSTTWLVNSHKAEIKTGDEVFFWEAGTQAGLVGWGTILTDPAKLPLEQEEMQFVVVRAKFEGPRLRVRIKVEGECYRSRAQLREVPALSNWAPIRRGVEGTNFRVPPELYEDLRSAAMK
jgi:EVE domain-containing protein